MKRIVMLFTSWLLYLTGFGQSLVAEKPSAYSFSLDNAVLVIDTGDHALVRQAAILLQQDMERVTGKKPRLLYHIPDQRTPAVLIGTAGTSAVIGELAQKGMISTDSLAGKWENYIIKTTQRQVVIAGSDRRGTAYGVFELSRQIGVSPWYWWADVPVKKRNTIYIKKHQHASDAPKVKYRGIFINDEAPALSGWAGEQFGGFNHLFYEKVFELILRLKGNYLWPAMWGRAFYDDDTLNRSMADRYGIVIGTSHHEPLMRAHDEWRRYGKGKWNYDSNAVTLQHFWKEGLARATNEKIVTIGMRGDGDEPMSEKTATELLERIVDDQRKIITEVTGKPAHETPQLWALYKEVQDYYDNGMRVPDDVTLLLCDDNWGNIRKLPTPGEKPRPGGYGIYYHFDYVGGPRNYKWINTNALPRIWEQMHLAWEYKARDIWIVNVGDIKPMELPISFFLDYAWDPPRIGPGDIGAYTEQWAEEQFGKPYAKSIAELLAGYTKFNARRKPELLDDSTYSLQAGEWDSVVQDYNDLLRKAETINSALPAAYRDAFFQLVLHPVKASANLHELYYNVARNKEAHSLKLANANTYAKNAEASFRNDSLITWEYHQLNGGKWNHMMSQTHIGYTYWQEPPVQRMPEVFKVAEEEAVEKGAPVATLKKAGLPKYIMRKEAKVPVASSAGRNVFYERQGTGISIEAAHYTSIHNTNGIHWQVLPDHGRTGSAITPFPVTAPRQDPADAPYVTYEVYTYSEGPCVLHAYFSPTLNFHHAPEGLQFAVSVDDEPPVIMSLNKEEGAEWDRWVSDNIITRTSRHQVSRPGKHIIRFRMVDPGVVLQKLVLDFGDTEKTYLGPPETLFKPKKK